MSGIVKVHLIAADGTVMEYRAPQGGVISHEDERIRVHDDRGASIRTDHVITISWSDWEEIR
jgi:hypothetical protein